MNYEHFPLFLPTEGKKVLVIGGGKVATRRIASLLRFSLKITVITLVASEPILQWAEEGRLSLFLREPVEEDFHQIFFCLLCTNQTEINEYWGNFAKEQGILQNQAQDKSKSDFFFPALTFHEDFLISLTGKGTNHKAVAELRAYLEDCPFTQNTDPKP